MWFAHFDCIQTALWLCPTSVSYSCNGELKLHVLAALFLAEDLLVAPRSMFCPALGAEAPLWLKAVLSAWPPSGTAKSKETKQSSFLSHHLIALQLCYRAHIEIGKVTLMRETPTVNHWLPGLFTHSLKGSPFKFDQYQPKSSQRVTEEQLLRGPWASGKTEHFNWAAYAGELDVHQTHF